MRAKKNRADLLVDPTLDLSPEELKEGDQHFNDWHWGIPTAKVVDWNDDDFPRILVECGRLIRLHVRAADQAIGEGNRHPRRKRDAMIEFSQSRSDRSHVAYDPNHAEQRLYFLIDPEARPTLARRLYAKNSLSPMPLGQVAILTGGRHGRRQDYPDVMVKPVGILTALVYQTEKQGDGLSFYIHQMGEISRYYPILAVDAQGRLWLAGGNYTAPTPGITD